MAIIQYQLKPAYVGAYTGGVIRVDDSRSYNVGTSLTAGSGTLNIDDTDSALVLALDNYAALRRVGTTTDAAPATITVQRRVFKGPYTLAARYLTGDEVTYQGDCWICTTDHVAGSFNRSYWTLSAKGTGGELAYAETTVNTGTLSNTTFAVIPNLPAITFEVADDPVWLELYLPNVIVTTATGVVQVSMWDQLLNLRGAVEWFPGVAFADREIVLRRRLVYPTVAKGTYTVSGYAKVAGASAAYGINPANMTSAIYLLARKG